MSNYLVATEASTYEVKDGWLTRIAGGEASTLRRDGEPIKVVDAREPVVGFPWLVLLQIRDDGVHTVRRTTPVQRVEAL